MARYPTVDEYRQKPTKGIQRCDELLQRNPNNVQLLTTKLQLTYIASPPNAQDILDQLVAIQPPIRDLGDLISIEEAVTAQSKNSYPQPSTAGPQVSKLWDNAIKATTSIELKLEMLTLRYTQAVRDSRMVDVQQSLIQWKAIAPQNRVVYMCHAIATQILSSSKEDLQSRLALSLARKAVSENFDQDPALDCRVPGQIFALQGSKEDLLKIKDRPFKESKQVYEALRDLDSGRMNGSAGEATAVDVEKVPSDEWLLSESSKLQQVFRTSIASTSDLRAVEAFSSNALRLFISATKQLALQRPRSIAEPSFAAVSALVKAFTLTDQPAYLLQAACLCESLLASYEHVHETKLILVYLYMRLGLGSLAMRHFDSLKIKEVQLDTVGHALFAGIAVTHPHKILIYRSGDFDPLEVAKQAMIMYHRYEDRLATAEGEVLDTGQTGMVLDLHQLRDSLKQSVTRRMILLEQRRIARLGITSMKSTNPGPAMPLAYWTTFMDNRDFEATFDYGLNVEKALHGHVEPRVWVLYALAADTVWCSTHTSMESCVQNTDELRAQLQERAYSSAAGTIAFTDTEAIEHLVGDVAYQLLQLQCAFDGISSNMGAAFNNVNTALDRLHIETLTMTKDGITELLPAYFSYVDSLRLVNAACDSILKRTPKTDSAPQSLKERVQRLYDQLRQSAKENSKTKAAEVKQHLASCGETWQTLQQLDTDKFCDQVAESARLGWESFLKISLT